MPRRRRQCVSSNPYRCGPRTQRFEKCFHGKRADPRIDSAPPTFRPRIVTAAVNTPPTSIGLPSVTVHDTVTPTFIAVSSYFNDVEDGPAGLRYTIESNTNPGLFAFAGINPTTGLLGLGYRPGESGTAVLTVRATDSVGASTSAVCTSTSVWRTRSPIGSIPTAGLPEPRSQCRGVLKYAFASESARRWRHRRPAARAYPRERPASSPPQTTLGD